LTFASKAAAMSQERMTTLKRILFLVALVIGVVFAVPKGEFAQSQMANERMPAVEQNVLVQKYCAVCHTDTSMTGGFSLQHFDAAHLDPSLAAMLLSKAKNGALGAAGVKPPDRVTQDAFFAALSSEAVGANEWTTSHDKSPKTQSSILTASILSVAPSGTNGGDPDIYRLTLTCSLDNREAEMKVSWAPWDVPLIGGSMSAQADDHVAGVYKIKNGAGAAILYTTKNTESQLAPGLPQEKLIVRTARMSANQKSVDPLPDETVVFPFSELAPAVRRELSACFSEERKLP
jgi:hypothetical protein